MSGALAKHYDLVRWLVQQGGFLHSDVVITYQADKGYHAVVFPGKSIGTDTVIARCPMETTLCVLNALNIPPFSCRGTRFPQQFLDRFCTSPEILQAFFLMEQRLQGDQSWWARYIATLPTLEDVQDLHFESKKDRPWIHGTNLEGALELHMEKMRENYELGINFLKQCKWVNATSGRLSWELFYWATTMFGTRSFTSQVLSDSSPADIARPLGQQDAAHEMLARLFSERFAVLLPVLDILNHRPAAQIEWQARQHDIGLKVLEPYSNGQELFNNYGPRQNESLLLSYGFVLEDNPLDHLVVSIRVPEGSPLADARTWPRDARSNERFDCYIFVPEHPFVAQAYDLERAFFSYDLLDSISVLIGNDRELGMMYSNQRTIMSMLPNRYLDFHNILAAISQLLQDVRARACRLNATDPTQGNPPIKPTSQKQIYAQQYRKGQLRILQNAIATCAFVILRACTRLNEAELTRNLRDRMPQFYSVDIERSIQRFSFMTRQHELFTVDEILKLIPDPTMTKLETCLQEIITALQIVDHLPSHHSDTMKAGFAIVLSAACCEYMNGNIELEARLSSWLQDLTQWYPPNDENWSYVPHGGPYEPGEEPPAALMRFLSVTRPILEDVETQSRPDPQVQQWLQPQMLCWGWNVLEEEGVRVPVEIEQFCNGIIQADTEEGAIGFLLYCKQY